MEVPSPKSGTVAEVKVAVGDRVSEGSLILTLEVGEAQVPEQPSPAGLQELDVEPAQPPAPELAPPSPIAPAELPRRADTAVTEQLTSVLPSVTAPPIDEAAFAKAHASPSIRRIARELGVDLGRVRGSGPKGRILKEDVQSFVKAMLTRPLEVAPAVPPSAGGLASSFISLRKASSSVMSAPRSPIRSRSDQATDAGRQRISGRNTWRPSDSIW